MAEQTSSGYFQSPWKFNGKELDAETGLYYYGARYYYPRLSNWLSVDPLAEEYPNQSPFLFCSENPVMRIDINGMGDGWVEDPSNPTKGVYWDPMVNTIGQADSKGLNYKGQTVFATNQNGRLIYGDANGQWHGSAPSNSVPITATRTSSINPQGGGVPNSTLDGINTAADLAGWFSNIWGDAARYSLESMSKTDVARPLVRGIGIGAKTIGYTGMVVSLGVDMYQYNQNPTWGNAGRVGVDASAIGISYAWPGPGTVLGVGTAVVNAAGGLNGFYNFLDSNQSLYNSTGHIMVPSFNPLNPLTIIKIK